MTQLTPNFTLAELTVTSTGLDNTPSAEHLKNLQRLALRLQLIRDALGRPIRVTSAYRSPAVNRAVGGVANSAHALGHAADIVVAGMSAYDLAMFIRGMRERVQPRTGRLFYWDQLILETSRGVVHVSFDPRGRGQVLTQAGEAGSSIVNGLVRPSV